MEISYLLIGIPYEKEYGLAGYFEKKRDVPTVLPKDSPFDFKVSAMSIPCRFVVSEVEETLTVENSVETVKYRLRLSFTKRFSPFDPELEKEGIEKLVLTLREMGWKEW